MSNAGLGVFGLAGVVENWGNPRLCTLYLWMLAACVCSATHHAVRTGTVRRLTLVLDLAPILVSVVLNLAYGTLAYWTPTTAFMALTAAAFLLNDLVDYVPVPWGHVMWHVSVSSAVAYHYRELALRGFE